MVKQLGKESEHHGHQQGDFQISQAARVSTTSIRRDTVKQVAIMRTRMGD